MASREGDGRHRRADEPRTVRKARSDRTQPSRQPPQQPRRQPRPARAPLAARDVLTHLGASRATRFTRLVFALFFDVGYGVGFVLGANTDSTTYDAMEAALVPLLGQHAGMWAWGLVLIVAGLLIPLGQIAVGAPIGFFAWGAFAVFNLLFGAWGFPLFAGVAAMHAGMGWFIVRDRRRATRSARDG